MIDQLLKSNIAIVGGGRFCKNLLELFYSEPFEDQCPSILGVADKNDQAEGLLYASRNEIFITTDYRELLKLADLKANFYGWRCAMLDA